MEKLFLVVYNDKSNITQVLESNYIDSKCLYSQKKVDFEKPIFVELKGSIEKMGVVDHT